MAKERVELFLARRISSSGEKRSGAMIGIARISVAISMAVMLVAIAVIGGFKQALGRELTGLDGHIKVEPSGSYYDLSGSPLRRNLDFEQSVAQMEHFASISPYASRSGIVRSSTAMQGAYLRGVGQGYDSLYFASKLIAGSLPRIGGAERKKDVLISKSLADQLEVSVGDKIEYLFSSAESPVRRDSYKVSGIYSTGLTSMELGLALTDLRNIQRINGWEEDICSGYTIMADEIDNMALLADNVRAEAYLAGDNALWRTSDLRGRYPQIFDWLATHDINGVVIVVIMIVVALLNMITALLIIIFERIRMIGTLRALGMRGGQIQKVFLWCSLRVILIGQFWGNLLAGALLLIQHHTGIIALDPEAYLISEVPVAFEWGWWLLLNVATPAVIVALLAIPVTITSRIKPDQTLKYQ